LPRYIEDEYKLAWHDIIIENFYLYEDFTTPFTGQIIPNLDLAKDNEGQEFKTLYGPAMENSTPLT